METEYIILISSAATAIVLAAGVLFAKKQKKVKINETETNEIIDALGGYDNIQSYESKPSRVNIFVNDISKVNANAIKSVSNCGVAIVNNKVQVILKDSSIDFVEYLKNLEKRG